jgi:hypothetical protein
MLDASLRRFARRLLTPLLVVAALAAVLLEATVWRWLSAFGRLLSRLPIFAALERLVEHLSPRAVIAVFVLPFVPILPLLKIGEIWLLTERHYVWAALVMVGAKVFGVAFSTRVFAIARPKMLQVSWFARLDASVIRLLALGHHALEQVPAWVAARAYGHRLIGSVRRRLVEVVQFVRYVTTSGRRRYVGQQWAAAVRWVKLRHSS